VQDISLVACGLCQIDTEQTQNLHMSSGRKKSGLCRLLK